MSLSVRISSTLARAAEARFGTDGTAWLCLALRGAGQDGDELLANWRMGAGPAAAQICSRTARTLHKGEAVTVHARSISLDARRILLAGVSLVEHHAHVPPHHQPAEREPAAA